MIDHITLKVSSLENSTAFYGAALGALGYVNGGTYDGAVQFTSKKETRGDIWIYEDDQPMQGIHIALSAATIEEVDAFHQAAVTAGGTDNGTPGVREEYAANYYGTFVLDPDGNNIEAVTFIAE